MHRLGLIGGCLLLVGILVWPLQTARAQSAKLVMIVMENESFSDIVGNTSQAPCLNQLIAQGELLADTDPNRLGEVVDAFLTAARGGDHHALLAILDPDVVMRIDTGTIAEGGMLTVTGATAVAGQAPTFQRFSNRYALEPVKVNGTPGFLGTQDGQLKSVVSFTITTGKIAAIDILSDPDRIAQLDITLPDR